MSITLLKKPQKFSSSGNPIIFQIETANNDIAYFKCRLIDDSTSDVISQFEMYPTPKTPKGSYINLQKLLDNTVVWEINNDSTRFVVPMERTVEAYRLRITERIFDNATSTLSDGDEYYNLSDVFYAFNGQLGRISATKYNMQSIVINSNNKVKFLTNKPNFSKVNDASAEHLYFLQDNMSNLTARVRTYSKSGALLNTYTESVPSLNTYKEYRLNVSPKSLKDSVAADFDNVHYYVVDVIDASNAQRTEERVYYYADVECNMEYVNLMWVNSYGAIDSYQWIAPQDGITTNRFMMKKNIYNIDDDGYYSDMQGDVYNPSDVIISNHASTVTKVMSKELSDAESYWLQELFETKQLFVELGDGVLVTALLNNSSYQIPRLRYVRNQLNQIQVEFTMSEGILPSGSHAYASNRTSIEFIDSQMNSIQQNLPDYDVTVDGTDQYNPDEYNIHSYE